MENKLKVWIARNEDGTLYVYLTRPRKSKLLWMTHSDNDYSIRLDRYIFPSVKWEDKEPTEAYITLANEPQQKKEIDWEQLRFKIANDVIAEYVSKIDFDEFENNIPQHIETTNKLVDSAINLSIKITNILMGELKSNIK